MSPDIVVEPKLIMKNVLKVAYLTEIKVKVTCSWRVSQHIESMR